MSLLGKALIERIEDIDLTGAVVVLPWIGKSETRQSGSRHCFLVNMEGQGSGPSSAG